MLYTWKLKSLDTGYTIKTGNVEAPTQGSALDKLRQDGIAPHTGELIEIIEARLDNGGGKSIILT